jgi:amino acid transporter
VSWNGFGLASILAVYSFLGYEGAVTLGEETANPRRNTPLAVAIAILSLGALYVLVTYSAVVGFGVSHLDKLASDSAAFDTLATRYLGGSQILIAIAGFTSTLGCGLAILNVQPRILYNVSRAGLFPKLISRSHPRWHTPYLAILVFGSIITAIPLIGSAFAVFGTWGGLPISCIYMLVNLALIVYWLAHRRAGSFLTHLVIPVVGMAVWVWPIYLAAKPASGLFGWTWIFVVAPLAVGIVFMLVMRTRRDTSRLAAVIAGEEEVEPDLQAAAHLDPVITPEGAGE